MRISTKITLGYGLLILLMVAALLYQVHLVRTMQGINRDLSLMKSRAAEYSLKGRDLDQIEEFTRKFKVTGDPEFSAQLSQMRRLLAEDLERVEEDRLGTAERNELLRLRAVWQSFSALAEREESRFAEMSWDDFDNWLAGHMSELRRQLERLGAANQRAIDAEVELSTLAGGKAEVVSKITTVVALVLAFVISFVIVRSISSSLDRLVRGTKAVAQGEFSYRLEASGDDKFSRVARDFNLMVSKLDEREQLKRDYVSHVSHELKAPLAAMHETVSLIMEGLAGPVNEKQKHLLALVIDSGERLRRTIFSLLDLSRMEADAFDYEMKKNDLRDPIRRAAAEFEVQFSQEGRDLCVTLPETPLWMDCDADRIGQIVSNLLDNARKFSLGPTPIRIAAEVIDRMPQSLPSNCLPTVRPASRYTLIRVADQGRGVSDEHKELIFEKFHQVKFDKKIKGQGVGLGLVICRNIAAAHGGAVWVEDNPNGGSVFCVLLPALAWVAPQPSAADIRSEKDAGHVQPV